MKILIELFLMWAAVALWAHFLPWVEVTGLRMAILVGLVLILLNATLWNLLRLLTFPINWITLWLMSFVISVLMILLASNVLEGFEVGGFWNAALFAIVLAIISMVFEQAKEAID